MFKAQILRRSFSLFNRVPTSTILRSAARDGHETIHIQRVHFKKRFFTNSRLIGVTFAAGFAYGFLQWIDLADELEEGEERTPRVHQRRRRPGPGKDVTSSEEEEHKEERGEVEDDEEEDEEEGLLFFPTGLSRPKPKEFYKGSDPEWQAFVDIARDRQRLDRIRGELISLVRGLAIKNPLYFSRLGKINPEAGSIWIEVRFPDGPPIEYERPGYELTDELNFRKTTRPVDEMHHQRLTSALVPTAVANSLYLDSRRRIDESWRDLKNYFGWKENVKPDTVQGILTNFPPLPPSASMPPASTTTASPAPSPPPAPSTSKDTQKNEASSASSDSPLSNPAYERFGIVLPDPLKAPTMNLSYFRQLFRKQHKHNHMQPPRGTFLVSGLIEIIGDRAKMTLDVTGAYDPNIGRYVMLRSRLRSITDYKQHPKGGP